MRHIFTTIILSVLTIFSIGAATPSDEYFSLMGQADKAIKDGKWEEAEKHLKHAMSIEPGNPSNVLLMSNLGMVQYYDGRDAEALGTLNSAHIMAPSSVTVLQNRAKILTALGRISEAEADYQTIISLDSTLIEPRFYRAMITLGANDLTAVEQEISTMQRIDPAHRLTYLAQATLLTHLGKYSEAITPLSKLIELSPESSYYGSLALCHLMTSQLPEAADDIARGLELDPTDGELYLYRAMLNKMRYRQADAQADGEKAIKFGVPSDRVKAILK